MLLGLIRAEEGSARVLAPDPWRDAVQLRRRVAHLPGDVARWPTRSGAETLDLLARRHGAVDVARQARLVEGFHLDPTTLVRAYSAGNTGTRSRWWPALSTDAELALLDEPTAGLDPLLEAVLRDEVGALRDRGATVLLSSRRRGKVERLCDTVTIIRDGRVVEAGTLAVLPHLTRSRVALTWLDVDDIRWEPASLEDVFRRHSAGDTAASGGSRWGSSGGAGRP